MRMDVTSTATATIHSADDNTVTSNLAGVAVLSLVYALIAIGGCLSLSIILVCMCIIIIGFRGNKHFCASTAKAASKSKSSNTATECHNLEVTSEQWQHNQSTYTNIHLICMQ